MYVYNIYINIYKYTYINICMYVQYLNYCYFVFVYLYIIIIYYFLQNIVLCTLMMGGSVESMLLDIAKSTEVSLYSSITPQYWFKTISGWMWQQRGRLTETGNAV